MTLEEYKIKIVNKLDLLLELHNYSENNPIGMYTSYLNALNELFNEINRALIDYEYDKALLELRKEIMVSIVIMELAIESGLSIKKLTI